MGERCPREAVRQSQRLSARAFGPVWDPDTGWTHAMWDAKVQPSGPEGSWACLLASLLWLSFLSQHAQAASISSAANITTAQTALSLAEGKEHEQE